MRKILLPLIGVVLALPAAYAAVQRHDIAASLFAFAEPAPLMEGCADVPEAVALAEVLRDRALRIERYQADLARQKAELADARAQIEDKLIQLQALKTDLRSRDTGRGQAVQQDIDRLVAVYDQMKPAEAAAVLSNLPTEFAAEILMRVQPESGARIIASVEPRQAALLTARMGARSIGQ